MSAPCTVCATAGPCEAVAVVFELSRAMRGSAHVTGTHHPHRRDHFTAVRACLGLVSAFQATASDEDLRRLARSRTGFQGSLTPYNDDAAHRPEVTVYPMESATGHEPSEKTAAAPTTVLRARTTHLAGASRPGRHW